MNDDFKKVNPNYNNSNNDDDGDDEKLEIELTYIINSAIENNSTDNELHDEILEKLDLDINIEYLSNLFFRIRSIINEIDYENRIKKIREIIKKEIPNIRQEAEKSHDKNYTLDRDEDMEVEM